MRDSEPSPKPALQPDDAGKTTQRKAYRPPELRPLGDMRKVTLKSGTVSDNAVHPTRP